ASKRLTPAARVVVCAPPSRRLVMHIPNAPLIAALFLLTTSAPACLDDGSTSEAEVFAVANPDGTVVCHKGNELAASFQAVPAHLAHGDFLGPRDAACAPRAS